MTVTGHRGASGYRPEHTLAAYALAVEQGADSFEVDLVPTRDGVLVARHESELGGSTDSQRPWARTTDITLTELRKLRAREPLPELRSASAAYDGRYGIPTLQEVLDLARELGAGVYLETKHPGRFARLGLPLEEPLLAALDANPDVAVAVQSFDAGHLQRLAGRTGVPLVQLLDRGDPPPDLAAIARYAVAIGAHLDLIVPCDSANRLLEPTDLVDRAHAAGLAVHAWTFRLENAYLPGDFRLGDDPAAPGDLPAQLRLFRGLGVDRVLTDHPDVASSL